MIMPDEIYLFDEFICDDGKHQRNFPTYASMLSFVDEFLKAFPTIDSSKFKYYKLKIFVLNYGNSEQSGSSSSRTENE